MLQTTRRLAETALVLGLLGGSAALLYVVARRDAHARRRAAPAA
jgi:hypothetical protein